MNTKCKLTIIVLLTFICLLNSTAQNNSGTETMTQADWVCTSWDDDDCEEESKSYTLNVTPNTPIKINFQCFTFDQIIIYTANRLYYNASVPTNGEQSVTVISPPTGTIYIIAYYGWNGKTINTVFTFNYSVNTLFSVIEDDQHIKGKLGVGINAVEKFEVQGNARINNRLSIGYPSSTTNENLYISNSNNTNVTRSIYSTISKNSTGSIYGLKSEAYNYSGNTYGIYSSVNGQTGKKWAGYFTGGDVEINDGDLLAKRDLMLGAGNKQFIFHTQAWKTNEPPIVIIAPKNATGWDFSKQIILNNEGSILVTGGKIGIGTTTPDSLLTVKGGIHARSVLIDYSGPLADFVFKPTYKLMPLNEVEQFVKTNSHLPEIPSAAEVSKNGMNMGEMQNKLLQKIEELTLYVIELQKTNEKQNAEIQELKQK